MPALALFVAFVAIALSHAHAQAPDAPRPLPHPLEPSREWRAAVANGTRTPTGRPGPRAWTNFAHYDLRAELDPAVARVRGHATLRYVNRSPDALHELVVHVRQNLHAPDAIRNVKVEITGGMTLANWQLDGKPLQVDVDGTVLHVVLPEPLAAGASATLDVDFEFTVPEGEAPRMGREGRELYFLGYWYPQFAVCDDVHGWNAAPYRGESEFYMPWADYDVAFTVPAGWLVQATGALQNADEVLAVPVRDALAKAAAGESVVRVVTKEMLEAGTVTAAAASGSHTWKFQARNVRDVAIATANCWLWDAIATEVGDHDGDGKPDRCVAHAFYRPAAKHWRNAARYTQHAIRRMSEMVMPYPWPHATAVEGILGGGMEYPMITLCGEQPTPFGTQSLLAHELAHMWFPMLVGNDENAHGWQDEGLADFYTARLEADFWKQRRPSAAQHAYTEVAGNGMDREPIARHADHLQFPWSYGFVCYTKPAAVLQQLGHMVGEGRLLAALRDYATAWRFAHPMPEDFFASMNESLQQDLDWYWSTWWTTTWTLDHAIAEVRANAAGDSEVVVEDRGLAPHPAVVQAKLADGSVAERTVPVATWLGGARSAVVTFPGAIASARLDPDQHTLDVDRSNDAWRRP